MVITLINKGNKAGIIKDLIIFPAFNNFRKPIKESRGFTEDENSKRFQVGIIKDDIFERILNLKRRVRTGCQISDKKIFVLTRYKTLECRAYIPYLFERYSEFKLINGTKLELPLVIGDKESVYTSFLFSINFDYQKYIKYKNSLFVAGMIISYNNIRMSKIIQQFVYNKFDFKFDDVLPTPNQ